MMKVPSLGGTKNIIRKDNMRVIKDMDPADLDCEKLLAKGHLVKGITLCAEDNPDLFCVTREQRSTRDLVDAIVADREDDLMFNYGHYVRPSSRMVWALGTRFFPSHGLRVPE